MKIGIVCPYNMFQFAGGVQEIVINLHAHLSARGHSVKIITPRPRSHFDEPNKDYILVGRSAKMNTPFNTMVDVGFEADGDEIESILENEKFDIIHFHEPWVPLLSRQILTKSNSINVATFHAKLPESILTKSIVNSVGPYTKSILKYIHEYSAVSEAAAEHVHKLSKVDINIIPNGIELDNFKFTAKKNNDKKVILYIGRLEKRKGVEYLIQAYSKLRETRDDVQLIIGGNGVRRNSLEKTVIQNDIPDVTFLGFVPDDQKFKMLAKADLFCSPALYGESFGIVLLEAMASGTPIVAGNNSGYSSVLTETGMTSLVSPKNTDDFTKRLELLLYDEPTRMIWDKWAKKAINKYDFKNIADEYEALYTRALSNHAR